MNEDREKKESLDELMDAMFRHHRLSSAGARQILEEAQKNQREAAATMKQSEDAAAQLNRILSEQTAAVQAQAKDLGFTDEDLRQLQQQVNTRSRVMWSMSIANNLRRICRPYWKACAKRWKAAGKRFGDKARFCRICPGIFPGPGFMEKKTISCAMCL